MSLGCAAAAHADPLIQFEVGIGASSYTRQGNGIFYNEGFQHSTPLAAFAYRGGLVVNAINAQPHSLIPGLRLHLAYVDFGRVSWDALSPQDADDFTSRGQVGGYNPAGNRCFNDNCGTMRDFASTGRIQAVALTVEPYWQLSHGWTVGVEAGPTIYRNIWTAHATAKSDGPFGPAGTTETLTSSRGAKIGVLVGASIGKGPFTLRYNYIFAPRAALNDNTAVVSGVKGAHMLTLNYTF